MKKTEEYYGFDPKPFEEDGLDSQDLEMIKEVLDNGNKELMEEIQNDIDKYGKDKLEKEFDEIMSIEDLNERSKKIKELIPNMDEIN